MGRQRGHAGLCARLAAGILVAASVGAHPAYGQSCEGPAELEARAQGRPTAAAYSDLGTWFGDRHQFACANTAFRSAVKLEPRSAKLHYFLGLSLFSSGETEASIKSLERSIQLDPKVLQPRLLLAEVFHQAGRRAEAEAQWQAALQIDPASTDALHGLSNSLMGGGDPLVAVGLLRSAKRNQDLDLDLARAYGMAGMLGDAEKTMQAALNADPSSLRLTNAMATVLVQQHRYQDAAALMRKYVDQHPDDVQGQIYYLRALVLNSDAANARPLGRKLLALRPDDFDVLYLNGILEREAGEYAAARDHLQQAVAMQPDDYSVRFNLGTALAHLNDAAGAKAQLEKAIAIDGSQAQAHFELAGVLRSMGDMPGAQQQLGVYRQLSAQSTARSQAATKAKLAEDKLAAGDAAGAAALYRDAVQETPGDAMLQYRLSLALDQVGDTGAERAALEQAVKIDPTMAVAQNQLGYLAMQGGDPAGAEKRFRLAVDAAPAFANAWVNLAATLGQEARYPEARHAVATALKLDPQNQQAQDLKHALEQAPTQTAHH